VQPSPRADSDPVDLTLIGDCHLAVDPNVREWPDCTGTPTFQDDDLGITPVSCSCFRLYLRVWRRVPGEIWTFLVPVTLDDIAQLRTAVTEAPRSYTDKWLAAERSVVRIFRQRPYLEKASGCPPVLRWENPGKPLAFGYAPM
jgi:hypothetical protein